MVRNNYFCIDDLTVIPAKLTIRVHCAATLYVAATKQNELMQFDLQVTDLSVGIYQKYNYFYLIIPEDIYKQHSNIFINVPDTFEKDHKLYDNWREYFGERSVIIFSGTELILTIKEKSISNRVK